MDIILLKELDKVGGKHEIVKVKDGYGRNFLIPQGLAIVANAGNRKMLNELVKQEDKKESKRLDEYKEMAAKLDGVTLKIGAKAGTSGKIFGSVTNVQIANALKEQAGIEIERKKIVLEEEVKSIGTYSAKLNLHKDVQTSVAFEIIEE
ncbi:MAG: 50S ribosomal protein L9 [Saprospiraceae bacterium]|jgi:large subunit ribosomal protein L9|uniref:50S ribosomal protein L9 n=1 Tax=Candidatus Brachybacter algidus TaxID=2982024 RepID=UPI001B68D0D3|nr:50S ribosomal protein L9 [Candidatus Brachybacter algidus]MBP7304583.1 50S ribosomal protein L9 [Saprospiraceae bacterium]MBK6372747.1 50S ribosomal protein L9 [Candidatus Brachybacter algidus]MBK6448282.1 50S ribosomal protein L9 [Candidatus Brachybacter algidus]MBK7605503.1 50S ribosomal protein L9 [Candidatus Brachybacter algidus]MBK8354231.1 50S ribosomal protein L9 [Candidatus Brachybacter algidus]